MITMRTSQDCMGGCMSLHYPPKVGLGGFEPPDLLLVRETL